MYSLSLVPFEVFECQPLQPTTLKGRTRNTNKQTNSPTPSPVARKLSMCGAQAQHFYAVKSEHAQTIRIFQFEQMSTALVMSLKIRKSLSSRKAYRKLIEVT